MIGGKDESLNLLLFVATAAMALLYRYRNKQDDYFRDITALWAGFGLGWLLIEQTSVRPDTANGIGFHLFVPGLAAMAVGWVLMRLKWLTRDVEPPETERRNGEQNQAFTAAR